MPRQQLPSSCLRLSQLERHTRISTPATNSPTPFPSMSGSGTDSANNHTMNCDGQHLIRNSGPCEQRYTPCAPEGGFNDNSFRPIVSFELYEPTLTSSTTPDWVGPEGINSKVGLQLTLTSRITGVSHSCRWGSAWNHTQTTDCAAHPRRDQTHSIPLSRWSSRLRSAQPPSSTSGNAATLQGRTRDTTGPTHRTRCLCSVSIIQYAMLTGTRLRG